MAGVNRMLLRGLMLAWAAVWLAGCGSSSVRPQAREEIRIVLPEAEYTLIETTSEGLPDVLTVNGALRQLARKDIFIWHLRVQIEAEHLASQGMPTPEESKLLFDVGDKIEAAVLEGRTERGAPNAVFLSRSTWNGFRELEYRVHNPEIAQKSLQALLAQKSAREWNYRMFEDTDWKEPGKLFAVLESAKK